MKRSPWLAAALILSTYLAVEAICALGVMLLRDQFHGEMRFLSISLTGPQKQALRTFLSDPAGGARSGFDPELGWVYKGGLNTAGMRDEREYDPIPTPGVLRIAAFGDSFTYGSDVPLRETWAKQIGQIEPRIEVLNYGVGGYGLDQAYLRFLRRGSEYHPHMVFIGFMSENIARSVSVFRRFYTNWPYEIIYTKPRFVLDGEELVLVENPLSTRADYRRLLNDTEAVLREVGRHDYYYRTRSRSGSLDFLPSVQIGKYAAQVGRQYWMGHPLHPDGTYNEDSEAYRVTMEIFDAFYCKVLEQGALPVIVVLPELVDQRRSRSGEPRRYGRLLDQFQVEEYRFVDLMSALEEHEDRYTIDDLVENWGHYSAIGNRIVARYLYDQLEQWELLEPATVRETALREWQQQRASGACRERAD